MKKFALMFALMFVAITIMAQETYKFPGWQCRDVAVLQQQLDLATNNWQKGPLALLLDLAKNGEPTSFADVCKRVDAVYDAIDPKISAETRIDLKKQFAINSGLFLEELAVYVQNTPSSRDLYIIIYSQIQGLDPEVTYQRLSYCLTNYGYTNYGYAASYCTSAIKHLNKQAVVLGKSDAEVLDLLKKLNRIYSAKLSEDKEVWGPVVAQIRTLIDTYQ